MRIKIVAAYGTTYSKPLINGSYYFFSAFSKAVAHTLSEVLIFYDLLMLFSPSKTLLLVSDSKASQFVQQNFKCVGEI